MEQTQEKIVDEEKEEKAKFDNVLQFKLQPSGKGPKDPDDWLTELEDGTVFLAQHRVGSDFVLGQFIIVCHFAKSMLLHTAQNPNLYVNPSKFSKTFILYEIIGKIQQKQEEVETEEVKDESEA